MQAFVHHGGQTIAYSIRQILEMVRDGHLSDSDAVWDESVNEWIPIGQFMERQRQLAQPVEIVTAPPILEASLATSGEPVFFDAPGMMISKTRFVIGPQTYAIAGITSVRKVVHPPSRAGFVVLMLLSGFLLFLGYLGFVVDEGRGLLLGLGAVGVGLIAFAIWCIPRQKPRYSVWIRTAAGEVQVFASSSSAVVAAIASALSQAIAARG